MSHSQFKFKIWLAQLSNPRYVAKRALQIGIVAVAAKVSLNFWLDDDYASSVRYFWSKRTSSDEKIPRKKRVVVLGTGWAALSFIQQLDLDVCELVCVSPRPYFFYTPLLAGNSVLF
jgi:hypothetical protein